ncbi:MAG: XTP/dITP diphosphatase [Victivallales bacterium]|nr:XTP/dITP diphosphatase [Victivallales bacterium]
MKIAVASGNAHKIQEIRQILGALGIEVLGADELGGMPEVIENGATFRENAAKKAVEGAAALGVPVLADDSGLEVKALNGAPGVYSARYAGEGGNDGRNLAKVLKELEGVADRSARFVCVMVMAAPDGSILGTWEGEVQGAMADAPRGTGGFGYDPAFIPAGYDRTFGELSSDIKNSMSHRGNALKALVADWKKLEGKI